jgi:hypothetical protein
MTEKKLEKKAMRQQKVSLQDILEARKIKKIAKGKMTKSSSNDRLNREDE